jgi:prepilin-type N-terminal cleavage/methylation domain-containing protein
MTMTKKQAFSLVELMVVIAIIGVLSSIAIPSYKSYVIKSRVAELLTIAETMQPLIAQKYNDGTWSTGGLSDLGLTSTATTYITGFNASSTGTMSTGAPACAGITCPSGTIIGSIAVQGNTTAIGVSSGSATLIKVGCVSNNIIVWTCGVSNNTGTANMVYFPSNCQTILGTGC